ncbi:hypothetical protein ABOM_011005 [Aspergillus bombycis]|uniref:DUF7587 domain-containing protein n=1 Tax=Aspergillus bombycis TaxID=109264 RepID=A0A1F7ZLY7_9EURO|nr:hypothetical protein ABOM_011005 [Aspergillus bombycis]OGM40487.1 hypothetical protein ABOM_011005 [Aspergillus bombycis]
MYTQWADLKCSGDPIWGHIHLSSFDDRDPWFPVIKRIQDCAKILGITLVEKEVDDIDTSNFQLREQSLPADFLSTTPDADESLITPSNARVVDITSIRSPVEIGRHNYQDLSLCTGGGKRCFWCYKEDVEKQETAIWIPPILYRWSNIESQGINSTKLFLAGLFIDELDYFAPNDINTKEFEQHVVNHTRPAKVPTPFISTFRSMLAPVHRAIKHKEGAIITMIDSKKLQTQVYSAQKLVRKVGLKVGKYNGGGEFFIWGKVHRSAIISSFKVSSLLQIASEHPHIESILQLDTIGTYEKAGRSLHQVLAKGPGQLDHQSGLIIGELLARLQVPQQYCHSVGQGIAYSWRLNTQKGSWQEFIGGVYSGYSSLSEINNPGTPLPAILDPDELDLLEPSSDEDTVTEGESSSDNDDQESEDDPRADTPCPVGLPTRTALPPIELFDGDSRRWITQENHAREEIIIDNSGTEDEVLDDVYTTVAFSNTLINTNVANDITESVTSANSEPELIDSRHQPAPGDQFASDRARVNLILN